jgi:hypothetical protein
LLIFLFQLSCTTIDSIPPSTEKHKSAITLNQVEQLQIGKSKKEEIIKAFGSPDLEYLAEDLKSEIGLIYFLPNMKSTRLSLSFDRKSGILDSISWYVQKKDSESNLQNTLSRYNNLELKKKWYIGENPHVFDDELHFIDQKTGILIVFKKMQKMVESINWFNTTTHLIAKDYSSTQKVYCINEICSPSRENPYIDPKD